VCRTAADVLARSGGADPAQRGRLLLEARDPEAALPLLLDAADAAVEVSARRALAVWVDAERALRLGGAATAPAAAQVSAVAGAHRSGARGPRRGAFAPAAAASRFPPSGSAWGWWSSICSWRRASWQRRPRSRGPCGTAPATSW
jgi:hypothetical protein